MNPFERCTTTGRIQIARKSDGKPIGHIDVFRTPRIVAYESEFPHEAARLEGPETRDMTFAEAVEWVERNTTIVDLTRTDPDVVLAGEHLHRIVYRVAGGGALAELIEMGWRRRYVVAALRPDGRIVAEIRRNEKSWSVIYHCPLDVTHKPRRFHNFRQACEAAGDATLPVAATAHDRMLREDQKARETALWDGPNPPVRLALGLEKHAAS